MPLVPGVQRPEAISVLQLQWLGLCSELAQGIRTHSQHLAAGVVRCCSDQLHGKVTLGEQREPVAAILS